jgi:hypothetical protein
MLYTSEQDIDKEITKIENDSLNELLLNSEWFKDDEEVSNFLKHSLEHYDRRND